MLDVKANPEEIEQFAYRLASFEQEVGDQIRSLNVAFSQLEETWIDEQQQRYKEAYQELLMPMNRLLEHSREHIPHLLKKAEILRGYHGQ